jgi:hypothetical protein
MEIILKLKTSIAFPKRHKNTQKTRRHQVEGFITKKVISMAGERVNG